MDSERKEAAAQVLASVLKLLEVWGLSSDDTPWNLAVNFHGGARRLDIAMLTPDGTHLARYVMGVSVDVTDLETFGSPVSLPDVGTVQ